MYIHSSSDHIKLTIRRHGNVQDFHFRMPDDGLDRIANSFNLVPSSDVLCGGSSSRSDGHRIQSMLSVSNQLAIGHNESGPDASDARTSIHGQHRLNRLQQQRIRKGFSRAGHGGVHQIQSGGIRSVSKHPMIPEPNEHVTDIDSGLFCWCRRRFR